MAEALGKFHYEVLAMPSYEFDGWMAYFAEKQKKQKAAEKKAMGKQSNKGAAQKAGKQVHQI